MKPIYYLLAFFYGLIFLVIPTQAQEVFYKKFTYEYGLPSSVTYRVFSDSRKFIWVSSDAGIARFDGKNFINYTAAEGVPDNEVFDIVEDSLGRVWFTTLKGSLGYINKGRVFTGLGNEKLDREQIQTVYFDRSGYTWVSVVKKGIYKLRKDSILAHWETKDGVPVGFLEDNAGKIWYSTYSTSELHFIGDNDIQKIELDEPEEKYRYSSRPILLKDGNILFYGAHSWGILNTETFRSKIISDDQQFANRTIISTMQDDVGNIWIGTSKGVILYTKDDGKYTIRRSFLEQERITSMTQDFEGNFWISTLSGGLYYIPCNPLTVSNYQVDRSSNNMSVVLMDNNNTVWLGNDEGNIFTFTNGKVTATYQGEEAKGLGRITCGTMLSNGDVCFGKDDALILAGSRGVKKVKGLSSIKSVTEDGNGKIWVGTYAQLIKVNPNTLKIEAEYREGRVTALYGDGERVWYANEKGLNVIEGGVPSVFVPASTFGNQRISYITRSSHSGMLLVSTLGSGIFRVDPEDGSYFRITTSDGLASNICRTIRIEDNGEIWIATKRGINRISFSHSGGSKILLVNHENGIIADEVNDIWVDSNIVWAATSMGVSRFERSSVKYLPKPPPVYIENVYKGNTELPVRSFYEFSHDVSQVKIRLVGLSYMSADKLSYKYKMDGLDSSWIENTSPVINYSLLTPGRYHFIAKAINSRGEESEVPAEVFITIRPAYWQTLWFKIFVGFILFLIILSSIVVRVKVIKKREEEKTRLNKMLGELELTALKAQMNPHFIFNSLGSIQNLINRDKKIEANIYLSKFAKLLRMTLDHSDKREVSLADEVNMLELYLGLEALRFVNKFEYKIEIDPEIDTYSIYVPPMILQPFIENAIKHGLLPKKEDAKLTIRFSQNEQYMLYCMVEDNGIGRAQREKLKEKSSTSNHVSKGIKITKNRLELVNQLRSHPAEIKITDLYKDDGGAAGTRIEIYIPTE